jgi:transcriptional regulator with XRE-family HTH domain
VRQDDVARAAGLSRPQITNALRGRFGLSPPAAARLHAYLTALPVRQPGLLPP